MSELLPSVQVGEITKGLVDFLTTTFALSEPEAQTTLQQFLQDPEDGIFRGPYVRLRLPFREADGRLLHRDQHDAIRLFTRTPLIPVEKVVNDRRAAVELVR